MAYLRAACTLGLIFPWCPFKAQLIHVYIINRSIYVDALMMMILCPLLSMPLKGMYQHVITRVLYLPCYTVYQYHRYRKIIKGSKGCHLDSHSVFDAPGRGLERDPFCARNHIRAHKPNGQQTKNATPNKRTGNAVRKA